MGKWEKQSRTQYVSAARQYKNNWSDMHVTGAPEEERKFGPEVIFEEKMAKNLPKMIKDTKTT